MSRRPRSAVLPPVPASVPQKLRCAIYTRKSTEEGLDQAFNTLHAQRDACEAYAASQRAEGWLLAPDRYDDGGFSGGTLERPALRRLLAVIEAGQIDVVVVYKIDRLSRSLTDFVKLVELFETHGVTFVSVTQAFNTTTSMGRLTLNILLSFAQFEREVIGERIRDKFAASRARGMWMGGKVPLGYDVRDRKLMINPAEADKIRRVFELFVETEFWSPNRASAATAEYHKQNRAAARQGRCLQIAEQPHVSGRSDTQGEQLPRRASGHCATGVVGRGAYHPAGKPTGPSQQSSKSNSSAVEGFDFRC